MKVSYPKPNILELEFRSGFEVCDATYRFSHYYEIPTWIGKIFTCKNLDDFYIQSNGSKNYWKNKWAGSNIPDHAFEPFLNGTFKSLNSVEKKILNLVKDLPKPYYVIMHCSPAYREHELAHALWYTNRKYRYEAIKILRVFKKELKETYQVMQNIGYSNKVLHDEVHVYSGIFYKHYLSAPLYVNRVNIPSEVTKSLCDLYETFA